MTLTAQQDTESSRIPFPKVVLFDWDDTLIDTWPNLWSLYQEVFHENGATLPTESYCREMAVRDAPKFFCDAMGDEIGMKARNKVIELYQARFLNSPKPNEGAKECLEILNDMGVPMGIVSNKLTALIISELETLGWRHFFQAVTGRDIVGKKPDPLTVTHTLGLMGHTPCDRVWFIGDSIVDHETATNAGCFSVGFGNIDHTPHESVTNWNQFEQILRKINAK